MEMIFSLNFHFKSFPETHKERKRERKDSRANREREIANPESWDRCTTGKIVNRRSLNPWTSSPRRRTNEPTSPRTVNPQTANPRIANPWPTNGEPTNPWSNREPTNRESHRVDRTGESHRYWSRSCDFDFLLSPFDLWFICCCCGGVGGGVLVVFLLCGGGFCVGGGGK